jgi:Methyltransferase domain
MKESLQPLTDALRRLVAQLENDPSLLEPNQLRQRLEALDRLDAHFPYAADPAFGPESIGAELHRRARTICAKLEAANRELYQAIRCEIQCGSPPNGLLRWVHPSPPAPSLNTPSLDIASPESKETCGPTDGLGYDYLDELLSGVLQFEEPGAAHLPREPEKVFYQPTPARHIFSLIRLMALTATDVLVDLGSGLGHVSLLVSMCTPARSIGIESEPAYVERAQQCAQRLNLNNVTFLQQDARSADLTTGTVFYFYTPFTGSILSAVLNRLKREAAARRIRICSYGSCTSVIANEPWLHAATPPAPLRVTVFHSRD